MTTEKIIEHLKKIEGINFNHYSSPKLCTKDARQRLSDLQKALEETVKQRDQALNKLENQSDELNRLHTELKLEKENGKEWEGVVREAYAKRDEALIERRRLLEKLDEYRSQLNAEFRVTPRASSKQAANEVQP